MSRVGALDWAIAMVGFALVFILAIWAVAAVQRRKWTTTIFEYQRGLRFKDGRIVETLGPGRHQSWWPGTTISIEDMREQLLVVPGQEVLTADNLAVRLSLSVRYRTADPRLKATSADNHYNFIYDDLQIALRKAVLTRTLEVLLAERGGIAGELLAAAAPKSKARGVEIVDVDVRDIMLAGETKRAYADIFRAKKDGEAALERARGETAALRNLANGARLLDSNPALFNLRLLQTLSTSASKGATVVLSTTGMPMAAAGAGAPASDAARDQQAPGD